MAATGNDEVAWYLKSSCPVYLPSYDALTASRSEFDAYIRREVAQRHAGTISTQSEAKHAATHNSDSLTEVTPSTTAEIQQGLKDMDVDEPEADKSETAKVQGTAEHPFMEGLHKAAEEDLEMPDMTNRMLTENNDLAYQSTTDDLVDLMAELEDVITGPRLNDLLNSAWRADPLMTLKLIFNARSIHLGKSSRKTFYMCAGWLAQNHPLTLVANLRWLSRPVIEKKQKKEEGDDEVVLVEEEKDDDYMTKYDVKNGVSHGYWKDLLNILTIAANGKLSVLADPADVLNSENPGIFKGKSLAVSRREKKKRACGFDWRKKRADRPGSGPKRTVARDMYPRVQTVSMDGVEEKVQPDKRHWKEIRRETREKRQIRAIKALHQDAVYRALHLTTARLFAEQLEADLNALRGDNHKAKRGISLCAKWAPSHDHFHDKHTLIVSSIAEILYPRETLDHLLTSGDNREIYLRHAREKYRVDTSALRKHLEVVERHITTQAFEQIKYNRVPSVAMSKYSKLFIEKDFDNFDKYIDKVAAGKSSISGATLFPSTLVKLAGEYRTGAITREQLQDLSPSQIVERKMNELQSRVTDGQWQTLVQRVRDSGTLDSCIAVADVSGSMCGPRFPDGTCPMDSSIGLSLLVASVVNKPFGGTFITFDTNPQVCKIDLDAPFSQQVDTLRCADWGGSTDFVAVFLDLILPMAVKNKLKQEDMVKRVFVFSDMQFNQAGNYRDRKNWGSSYDTIKKEYAKKGYEMPELVFWNLAGGRGGMASKPVTTEDKGTCLVSGYSQGMLKVFLDSGGFEDPGDETEDAEMVVINAKGEEEIRKDRKIDPLSTVKKAVSHKAYEMLEVLD